MVGKRKPLKALNKSIIVLNGFGFKSILYLRITVAIGSNDRLWDLYRGSCPLVVTMWFSWCDRSGAVTSVYSIYLAN